MPSNGFIAWAERWIQRRVLRGLDRLEAQGYTGTCEANSPEVMSVELHEEACRLFWKLHGHQALR